MINDKIYDLKIYDREESQQTENTKKVANS